VILEPISIVIQTVTCTIIWMSIWSATCGLIREPTVSVIRMSRCRATFGVSCDAVCAVVSMVTW